MLAWIRVRKTSSSSSVSKKSNTYYFYGTWMRVSFPHYQVIVKSTRNRTLLLLNALILYFTLGENSFSFLIVLKLTITLRTLQNEHKYCFSIIAQSRKKFIQTFRTVKIHSRKNIWRYSRCPEGTMVFIKFRDSFIFLDDGNSLQVSNK